MTYYEITVKLKDLTMTPADWSWLDNYLKETGHAHVYAATVNAYQAREAGKLPKCGTEWGLCRYCAVGLICTYKGVGFICTYKGFCSHQRAASTED